MSTETASQQNLKAITKEFWGLVTKHDLGYIDIHRITGLGNAQLARWNKYGDIHAPDDADKALDKLVAYSVSLRSGET